MKFPQLSRYKHLVDKMLKTSLIPGIGKQRYWNIIQKDEEGCRSMYRPASENKFKRAVEKSLKQREWWGSKHDSVMFVQATPGSQLMRQDLGCLRQQ